MIFLILLHDSADDFLLVAGEANAHPLAQEDKIVIVDGCKGNTNVTDLIGDEVAVIDHHNIDPGGVQDDVKYSDIRSHLEACSTLIYSYFQDLQFEVPRNISTALLTGLLVGLVRKTSSLIQISTGLQTSFL